MKKILLTGITGQIGQELQQTLAPLGRVIGLDRKTLDLTQRAMIRQVISEVKPDLIINCAAHTQPDKAESETKLVRSINTFAPIIMAEEAQQLGATLIHISTQHVFDGRKNTPYTEEDIPNPINAYGQSKFLGEQGVQQKCERHIILRTAWVYSTFGKRNFVKTMLKLGAEREELHVVFDQVSTSSWARDIAQAVVQLISLLSLDRTQKPTLRGIYHLTNSGIVSRYDFAVAIFEEAQQLGFPLKVQRVVPITTPEYPTLAQRPAYSVLSNKKISAVLGTYPSHWRKSLRQMLKQLYFEQYRHSVSFPLVQSGVNSVRV